MLFIVASIKDSKLENRTHTASDVNGASKQPTPAATDVTPRDWLLQTVSWLHFDINRKCGRSGCNDMRPFRVMRDCIVNG